MGQMSMMYELMYILPSQYSDSEIEGLQKNVADLVVKIGAKVEQSEVLGKIKLAYPIKKYDTVLMFWLIFH